MLKKTQQPQTLKLCHLKILVGRVKDCLKNKFKKSSHIEAIGTETQSKIFLCMACVNVITLEIKNVN